MKQIFSRIDGKVHRQIVVGGIAYNTTVLDVADPQLPAEAAWWQAFLRGERSQCARMLGPMRVVDAFSGSGGLSLGIQAAINALGARAEFTAVIDTDALALEVHRHNLGTRRCIARSVASLVDFHVLDQGSNARFGYPPEILDSELLKVGNTDLFVAGPPCQGHSNLNNHTRRQDPRNDLYVTAAALGVALEAGIIILENVPTVQNSHSEVVATACSLVRSAGYGVTEAVLKADEFGAAQRRTRHFLIAIRNKDLEPDYLIKTSGLLAAPTLPISWAIGDLLDHNIDKLIDTAPNLTSPNRARIDYLFDHNLYDLPDDQRPDCHKDGTTYTAVYGRMHWDRPAQTITTGFGTPGQGRYVHPLRRRVITPHEAARIQGFPDWFELAPAHLQVKRKHLNKWIGDAVHPVLGYVVGLAAVAAKAELPAACLSDAA